MQTIQKILFTNAKDMAWLAAQSVQLIVTSPPYPMIEMWDELFSKSSPEITKSLDTMQGLKAFELMHKELDAIWTECYRVLTDGGFICINIGDATRTVNNEFQLYSNHSRILKKLTELGLQILPEILWRKQTNAPNKFMGSGMLPAGAYVTLEHEFILIARKNGKREFKTQTEKSIRQESGYFWEERNVWFSDIWEDIKGINQKISFENSTRERSAAFPFELAYRLVNMYSVKGDVVLDPFVGTGTTLLATLASERNGIGIEIEKTFENIITERINSGREPLNLIINERLKNHEKFIQKRLNEEKIPKYKNVNHKFPVITKQEENLLIRLIKRINQKASGEFEIIY